MTSAVSESPYTAYETPFSTRIYLSTTPKMGDSRMNKVEYVGPLLDVDGCLDNGIRQRRLRPKPHHVENVQQPALFTQPPHIHINQSSIRHEKTSKDHQVTPTSHTTPVSQHRRVRKLRYSYDKCQERLPREGSPYPPSMASDEQNFKNSSKEHLPRVRDNHQDY